jgi:hypothetical protein
LPFGRGGIVRARALFGVRLPALLDELTETLVAGYLSKISIKKEGGGSL